MHQQDLYDMMQDPDIPAEHKRAVLNQLQQQAEPDSPFWPTLGALTLDAGIGTVGGKMLDKTTLFDKVAAPGTLMGKAFKPSTYRTMLGNLGAGGLALGATMLYDHYAKQNKYRDPLGEI